MLEVLVDGPTFRRCLEQLGKLWDAGSSILCPERVVLVAAVRMRGKL